MCGRAAAIPLHFAGANLDVAIEGSEVSPGRLTFSLKEGGHDCITKAENLCGPQTFPALRSRLSARQHARRAVRPHRRVPEADSSWLTARSEGALGSLCKGCVMSCM